MYNITKLANNPIYFNLLPAIIVPATVYYLFKKTNRVRLSTSGVLM